MKETVHHLTHQYDFDAQNHIDDVSTLVDDDIGIQNGRKNDIFL